MLKRFFLLTLCLILACAPAHAGSRRGGQLSDTTTYIGLNIGGMAEGSAVPGSAGTDYIVPTCAQMSYYRSQNYVAAFRLPIMMERAAWNSATTPSGSVTVPLAGVLNTTYMGQIHDVLTCAATLGIPVIVDMHNFGHYNGQPLGTGFTAAQLTTFMEAIATDLQGYSALGGYDVQNEPNDSSSSGMANQAQDWFNAYQAVITGVRTIDTVHTFYIEGFYYANAFHWSDTGYSNNYYQLVDPNNNLTFEAHSYLDADSSGSYPRQSEPGNGTIYPIDPTCPTGGSSYACAQFHGDVLTTPPSTLDTNILVKRYTPFVQWCKLHSVKGMIGETGIPPDDVHWQTALDLGVKYLIRNKLIMTYWNADGISLNYALNIDLQKNGLNPIQAAVLTKETNPYPPTLSLINGPQYGTSGVASSNFALNYNGYIKVPFTFTPNDNGAGGTFTPSSLSVVSGFNYQGNFTYTAPSTNVYAIGATNSGQLPATPSVGYATVTDQFLNASIIPNNIYSVQKIYAPYIGPLFQLRRASDNATMDFSPSVLSLNGTVSPSVISTWLNGSNGFLTVWYDQGPNANNIVPAFTDVTPSTAQQPQYVASCQNSLSCFQFNGSNQLQATSPINGSTAQTVMAVFNPTNNFGGSVVAWGFGALFGVTDVPAWRGDLYTQSVTTSGTTVTAGQMRAYTKPGTWGAVATSYQAGVTDGMVMMTNGLEVGKSTPASTPVVNNRTYMMVGWDLDEGNSFVGQLGELIVQPSGVSPTYLSAFHTDQISRWNLSKLAAYTYQAPTLTQNTGTTENPAPWRGVAGTGLGVGFGQVPDASFAYWAGMGANIYRYVVSWEDIQPNLCTGDMTISSTELAKIDHVVSVASSNGLDVLIDLHNYGSYNYNHAGTCGSPPAGNTLADATTLGYFVNYWHQMDAHYAGNYKVKFDSMNEPTAVTDAVAMSSNQALITDLRGAGSNRQIFVEFSTGNSACGSVASAGGPAFVAGITDAANRTYLNCHSYLTTCGYDGCVPNANNGQGTSTVTNALTYIAAHGIKLFWGEAGIASFSASQYTETKAALDKWNANPDTGSGGTVGFVAWGAGTWPESYYFKQDPLSYNTPIMPRPTNQILNTYFTGGSWKCKDGSTGTNGICSGTWPAAQF